MGSNTPSELHYFAVIHPCLSCGEKAGTTFDRTLCACGMMHNYCENCGAQADPCWDEPRFDSNYWYMRKPYWFWGRAATVVCLLLGHKKEEQYADCYRCG